MSIHDESIETQPRQVTDDMQIIVENSSSRDTSDRKSYIIAKPLVPERIFENNHKITAINKDLRYKDDNTTEHTQIESSVDLNMSQKPNLKSIDQRKESVSQS